VNSQFSYYLRGSFVAMALDLMQRAAGEDAPTLDDLMHALWREFGQTGRGVPENPEAFFSQWAQRDLGPFFQQYVNGTEDPDWATLFASFGIVYRTRPAATAADRGGRDESDIATNARTLGMQIGDGGALPVLKHVLAGSSAWRAGLSAGDTLIAIDGLRAGSATLGKHLARFGKGDRLEMTYFRHDELRSATIEIPEPPLDTAWLEAKSDDPLCTARRDRWLGSATAP
jgi:predicted metalloprotease with PDZ domain